MDFWMFGLLFLVIFGEFGVLGRKNSKKSKMKKSIKDSQEKETKSSNILGGLDLDSFKDAATKAAMNYGAEAFNSMISSKATSKEEEKDDGKNGEKEKQRKENEEKNEKIEEQKDAEEEENSESSKTKSKSNKTKSEKAKSDKTKSERTENENSSEEQDDDEDEAEGKKSSKTETKKPFVEKINLSHADKSSIETIFKEALSENSMPKLLYAISFGGLFRKEGEKELKTKLSTLFLEKLEAKQPGNSSATTSSSSTINNQDKIESAFYLNFLHSLKYVTYFQELSLFMMWIAANIENSPMIHQILFAEQLFSLSNKQYFLEMALSTRNKYIFEALAVFLEKFYQGPAVTSDNLAKALANCSTRQMYDFLECIFTKDLHKKYPMFYWRLKQIKSFQDDVFDALRDKEFAGKQPDKTFAPLIK